MEKATGNSRFTNRPVLLMNRLNFKSLNRMELRRVWNGKALEAETTNMTPFRVANNAGDSLSRRNYSCGGPNQLSNTNKNQLVSMFRGSLKSVCDSSNVAPASCNTTYVYDSSTYSKFKRQVAMNTTYSESSFGGANNGAYVPLKHARI